MLVMLFGMVTLVKLAASHRNTAYAGMLDKTGGYAY